MHSYGRLPIIKKIALLLCFPDALELHVNPDSVDAGKADKAIRDFDRSVERCDKLGQCYEKVMAWER